MGKSLPRPAQPSCPPRTVAMLLMATSCPLATTRCTARRLTTVALLLLDGTPTSTPVVLGGTLTPTFAPPAANAKMMPLVAARVHLHANILATPTGPRTVTTAWPTLTTVNVATMGQLGSRSTTENATAWASRRTAAAPTLAVLPSEITWQPPTAGSLSTLRLAPAAALYAPTPPQFSVTRACGPTSTGPASWLTATRTATVAVTACVCGAAGLATSPPYLARLPSLA